MDFTDFVELFQFIVGCLVIGLVVWGWIVD